MVIKAFWPSPKERQVIEKLAGESEENRKALIAGFNCMYQHGIADTVVNTVILATIGYLLAAVIDGALRRYNEVKIRKQNAKPDSNEEGA